MGASLTPVPPAHDEGAVAEPSRAPHPWFIDDIVVVFFALFGLAGGVLLLLFLPVPPITTSFLLAMGRPALTYRFLGGIQSSSVSIGIPRLSGSSGAMVGVVPHRRNLLAGSEVWHETFHGPTPSGEVGELYCTFFRKHSFDRSTADSRSLKPVHINCRGPLAFANSTSFMQGAL